MATLSGRLRRYSEKCVSDRLDEDFAKAVQDAADIIELIEYSKSVNSVKYGQWVEYYDEIMDGET